MRKIVHIDMDAFFVSVEIRDNPSLAGKPVAVGGKSDRRGVLSTCNYIARQYGVSSAMPTAIAKQKCPNLVVVPGRMEAYREASEQIREIFEEYTGKIEPLSLDEAYLDLSESSLHQGSATLIAQEIRAKIYKTTMLTASAGIAPIKFLAKIASDINKPNNQFTIAPNDVLNFIETLPLKKIPGVGKVTTEKLKRLGLETGGDIRRSKEIFLIEHFGKYGRVLWDRCHGIDNRAVEVSRIRKSVGVERTFEKNVSSLDELSRILIERLLPELERRAQKHLATRSMNKLGVKVKFADFQQTTKEQKHNQIERNTLIELLQEAFFRGNGKSVRLLGIHIGLDDDANTFEQLNFDL
ncbi:DNA polymerase IV [Flocculibacter collagenilyticus]|uniref:DNA polymerase IV n=1 Tax=Flocculibacter collagenilyticus TaxID=2744479 RepID=UPI0018F6D11E|nr:DNA polymerase IV [Flocculibacter collagenilyticus]